jgi:hypothetical protein
MRKRFILSTLFLALPLISQAAQTSSGPSYRISGKVLNAVSGAPLGQCVVHISDTKNRGVDRSVVTADDGRFVFNDVLKGKYGLSAEKHGFVTESYQQHDQYSTAIAVGPDLVYEGLTFPLTPTSMIFGFVYDESGEAVRNAQVRLFKDQDGSGTGTIASAGMTSTDDHGRYEFANLARGAYFLVVSAKPWYAPQNGGRRSNGTPPKSDPAIDVAYPLVFYPNVTDADSAVPIPVKGGDHLQIDFNLTPQPAVHLRIRIPELDPRAGVSVSMSQSLFGEEQPQQITWQIIEPGLVEVSGTPPGHYELSVSRFDGKARQATKFGVDAGADTQQTLDSAGQQNVAVTGKVTLPAGKRSADAFMMLRVAHSSRAYGARLDDKDEFSFLVPPGTYEVRGQIPGMYLAKISAEHAQLTGRSLKVEEDHPVQLNVVIGSSYGQIDGYVQRDGKPMSGQMVVLVPADPGNNEILFRRDQSDSDGSFTLAGILPGSYRLLAIENGWSLEWARPEVIAAFLPNSKKIQIEEGEHLTLTIPTQPK